MALAATCAVGQGVFIYRLIGLAACPLLTALENDNGVAGLLSRLQDVSSVVRESANRIRGQKPNDLLGGS